MISNNPSLQFKLPRFLQLLTSFLTSLVLFILLSLLLLPMAHSAQLKLAWDPNSEPDLAGYKLYYRTTQGGPYNSPGSPKIIEGNITTYTLTGLTPGQTYYIVATAYDTSNNESGYSNQVNGVAMDPIESIIFVSLDGTCSGNTPCFTSIQNAISSADTFTTIVITEEIYLEDVILNNPIEIILPGGWDSTFTNCLSWTTIYGSLMISNGALEIENIILR